MKTPENKSTHRRLLPTARPILFTMVLAISLNFVDTWFMSQLSDEATGAIGALFPIIMIYMMVFSGLAQGGVNVGSQYKGASSPKFMRRCFSSTFWLVFFTGAIISLLFTLFVTDIALLMGIKGYGVIAIEQYFLWLAPFVWVRALYHVYSSVFNALGKGMINTYLALGANVLNIALDWAFIEGYFGQYWASIQGLALATLISQTINVAIMAYIMRNRLRLKFKLKHFYQNASKVLQPILRIAGPAVIEPIAFQVSQFIYALYYVQLGAVAMSTRIYTMNLLTWCILWSSSLGSANQILVAEFAGAKKYELAMDQMKRSYKYGIAGAVTLLIPLAIFSEQLMGIFTDNIEIIQMAVPLLLLSFILETGRSINLIVGGSLRATGDSLWTTIMSIGVIYLLIVPLAYYLTLGTTLGLIGLWIAMSADEWIRGLANLRRWKSGRWQTMGIHKNKAEVIG